MSEGLEQTARYADLSNASEAHLVVCDQRPDRSWEEKIYDHLDRFNDRAIHVWGM
ncbi:MAG: hypothetical protein LBR61_09145 [Synergistaceae bacterium]|nr:hypothetical protein [Synergistaceae bacterium]